MKLHSSLGMALGALLLTAATAHAQDAPIVVVTPAPQPAVAQPVVVVASPPPTTVAQPIVVVTPDEPAPVVAVVPADEEYDRWNMTMFSSGALIFVGTYSASAIVAGTSDRKGDDRLFVPVLGPWLDLADRGACPIDQQTCDSETTAKVLLVADGVFQAAGLLAMVDGIFIGSHHHRSPMEARRDYEKTRVAPVHMGPGAPGLAVMGRF
ncbi:MAG: hypothetical protein K8W52_27585 [Deltaproteobacteria bacterium]|nr:hypothetical protein [Deltaproteobacteria bacterium]